MSSTGGPVCDPAGPRRPTGVVVPVAFVMAVGCTGGPEEPVIAVVYNRDVAVVAQAAIDSAHRSGGPHIRIQWSYPDVPGQALERTVAIARQLAARPEVIAVVGPAGSQDAILAAAVYNGAGIPQLVPTATSRRLGSLADWTFTLAPNDSVESKFIADFVLVGLLARTISVYYTSDEYGTGLHESLVREAHRDDLMLLDEVPVQFTAECQLGEANPYADAVRLSITRGVPDVTILATRTAETTCLIAAFAGEGVQGAFVAADGTVLDSEMLARLGPAADSLFAVAFWHPDVVREPSRALAEGFERLVGHLPTHGQAMAYDGILVAAEAIRTVGPDRRRVRDYLRALGGTRAPYEGATGPIQFQRPDPSRLVMTRVREGEWVLVARP